LTTIEDLGESVQRTYEFLKSSSYFAIGLCILLIIIGLVSLNRSSYQLRNDDTKTWALGVKVIMIGAVLGIIGWGLLKFSELAKPF